MLFFRLELSQIEVNCVNASIINFEAAQGDMFVLYSELI